MICYLNHGFINYESSNSPVFVKDMRRTKSLNPVTYSNMTPFSSLNDSNAFDVLRRLTKKYK